MTNDEQINLSAAGEQMPDLDGATDNQTSLGEAEDRAITPRDRPLAVNDWGTTAAEQRQGEPLAERLARELPELGPDDIDERDADDSPTLGRLVADDEGSGEDREKDSVAHDVGRDSGIRSAEEAAMHLIEG